MAPATDPSKNKKPTRHFLPQDFQITDWASLESYFRLLADAPIHSLNDLHEWVKWKDELEAVISEESAWRYIHMTCHTENEEYASAYTFYVEELQPKISEAHHRLQQRYASLPWRKDLPIEGIELHNRLIDNEIELFREENLPLISEDRKFGQQYSGIIGAMTVTIEGEELTLPQASKYLQNSDRSIRENAWHAIQTRRSQDTSTLNTLFDGLVKLRARIAKNADFDSYTDYRFRDLARFDYGREACLQFHQAVETAVRPLYIAQLEERKQRLGLDRLRPWDLRVDWWDTQALHPFTGEEDLINKSIMLFQRLHNRFADMVVELRKLGHLDLASRKGKAPGGYNYPLAESGSPFIFMNAADTHSDLKTMVHECGHSFHSFLSHVCVPLAAMRDVPSEVAELASMSMELLTMNYWDTFYTNERDFNRARHQHLTGLVGLLPWIATVDAFQFWIYDHPEHTAQQRAEEWVRLYHRFHGDLVDWTGLEPELQQSWHAQLHLFEVPFYYIEYGIAQLGALQLWHRYQQNPKDTLRDYQATLSLGYTRTIPELYERAGIAFDFSEQRMKELFAFVGREADSYSKALS